MRSNKALCPWDFLWALPSGIPSGEGVYLTVHPPSHPNTDTVYVMSLGSQSNQDLSLSEAPVIYKIQYHLSNVSTNLDVPDVPG